MFGINLLNASAVWASIGSVLLAVLILLIMVTVHEFGHYIAGKILKFKINEFSIGFGPAVFQHKSKKNGEKFSLRLIPLGGYCAFEDEDGLASEEENDEKTIENIPVEEIFKDEKITPEKEEKLSTEADCETKGEKVASGRFCDQKPWKRIIVLIAGATMNYLLALLFIITEFFAYGQTMLVTYEVEPSQTVSAEYSFHDKDIILQAAGRDVYMTTDLMSAVKNKQAGDTVEFYVSRLTGETDENGKGIREEKTITVELREATNFKNSADVDRLWEALGIAKQKNAANEVQTDDDGNPVYMIYSTSYRFGFFKTLGDSFVYSFRVAGSIFKVLGELLTGALGLDTMGGPITTITVTSQIVSRGFRQFLEISAYIGVNLAVFNLLPIPALDGSKVVFTLIEWVRGKPVNRKVEAMIHAIGFLLIFGFAILVDILQFI